MVSLSIGSEHQSQSEEIVAPSQQAVMNKSPNTNLDSSGKTSENLSASALKIKPITNSESGISTESEEDIPPTGFRLIDMDILSCVIAKLPCPDCI